MADIQAAGGSLIAITPQLAEKSREMIEAKKLGFDMLTDAGNAVAAELGLRFTVAADLQTIYRGFEIDLEQSNGDASWTLPMPARYVIDRNSVIRYARVHPDYTKRPEIDETLSALREV